VTVTIDAKVEQFIGTPRQAFINGQFVDAASGKTFETPNPATGETSRTSSRVMPRTSTAPSARREPPSTVRGAG
jgi:hypothetical protein